MDLATIGWISLIWLAISVVVSLAVGRMFQHGSVTEADLEQAAERQQVVRYLRGRKTNAQKVAKAGSATRRSAVV
jgi:type VI protein secretion system component VasK